MTKPNPKAQDSLARAIRRCLSLTPLLLGATFTDANALSVVVKDGQGAAITTGYRWMIQEDQTHDSVPGQAAIPRTGDLTKHDPNSSLSYGFHSSHSPVIANGHTSGTLILDPNNLSIELDKGNAIEPQSGIHLDSSKRYFISILPDADATGKIVYTMGSSPLKSVVTGPAGAQHNVIDLSPTAETTVTVHPQDIPTAQISIFVHEDNQPINNTPDLPAEAGLAGFTVKLSDAGGGYGAVGGPMSTDAFGNPLGTEYDADGNVAVDELGNPKLGTGSMTTGPDGTLLIKNLAPGKYTVYVDPPCGLVWQAR